MSRNLPDWIEGYLTYVENTEPPRSYHLWCALSVIAGALQRKVRLEMGFEVLYPNLFVILIGPSGGARKGVALGIAKSMLQCVPGVAVAPESTSGREAIVGAMKRVNANYQDPTDGKIKFHCSLTAFSEELSVFLGQGDIKLLANMTDWYDSKDNWEYETIGRGIDSIQGLCFNLMGATAPEWIQSMLPHEAIGGGFTSRVIFVVEERKGKTVPDHSITNEEAALGEMLVQDLERINQLSGAFTLSPEARAAYSVWYTQQDKLLAQGKYPVDDPRFRAYCERRQTHLRKVMMLCSASRSDAMKIELQDLERAKGILVLTEQKMGLTFGGLGKSLTGDATEQIKNYIETMQITTRSLVLARFYRDIDSQTLRVVEDTLYQMGLIKVELLPTKGDKSYTWIGPTKH